jgi:protein phosphatase-4 regulatory subunit 3
VAQLLTAPQKHLKLVALKFFRTLISLQDTFYQALMTHNNTFGLILDIVYETMPRDNLLNSACLELFEFIKRENIKPFILHVVEKYREKLENITYVDTFQNLILRYDQMQGYGAEADSTLFSQDDGTPRRMPLNGQRWQGVKELDAAEEEYFNTSDDEDEWAQENRAAVAVAVANGSASPVVKPLVDYPDDDDDDAMDTKPEELAEQSADAQPLTVGDIQVEPSPELTSPEPSSPTAQTPPVPERLSEKRRREEEDEDELVKLAAGPKRRSSTSSNSGAGILNRKKTLSIGSIGSIEKGGTQGVLGTVTSSAPPKRIAINIGPVKSSVSDNATCGETVSSGSNEKENRDDSQAEESG